MKAAIADPNHKGRVLLVDRPMPTLTGDRDVILQITHSALNRADILQCRGLYPPPPDATDILGLEAAGVVVDLGTVAAQAGWTRGMKAMALLPGGGHAEYARVDHGSLLKKPATMTNAEAGAFIETTITAYLNIFELARLNHPPQNGVSAGRHKADNVFALEALTTQSTPDTHPSTKARSVLIHGGSGGVGVSALRLLRADTSCPIPHEIWSTAGNEERCARVLSLGARRAVNHRTEEFATCAKDAGVEFDVVLDCIGARYLGDHLRVLATDGHLVVIGLMGGTKAELNMATLIKKRIQITGSALRPLNTERKAGIIARFVKQFSEALQTGRLNPIIEQNFKLSTINTAHQCMQSGEYFGKISIEI